MTTPSKDTLTTEQKLKLLRTDPPSDGIRKLRADYFPYPPGTIELLDEEWYVAYRVADNRGVQVSIMRRVSDLQLY